ncbi:hypothetical protein EPO05_00960 [Patescibacteria group bacterium]|nr:MAG: hypothetical protein EPO05_00960 [Patescibacteria group bacterium]
MKRFGASIYTKLAIVFVFFLALAIFIKGDRNSEFIRVVMGAASFVFGIILAFSTANRHSRLSQIRESLREGDAVMLNIYELSKVFSKDVTDETRRLIDELLIIQCDYFLRDFDNCVGNIDKLYVFIEKIKATNKVQEDARSKMLSEIEEMVKVEKKVIYHVNDEMLMYEWISLIALEGVILFCLYYLKSTDIISVVLTATLSALLVMLLLILRDLDLLVWQESNWIWEPLSKLFVELGLDPYFPGELFKKRIKLDSFKKFKRIRIASYPKPYPDLSGKKIKLMELK